MKKIIVIIILSFALFFFSLEKEKVKAADVHDIDISDLLHSSNTDISDGYYLFVEIDSTWMFVLDHDEYMYDYVLKSDKNFSGFLSSIKNGFNSNDPNILNRYYFVKSEFSKSVLEEVNIITGYKIYIGRVENKSIISYYQLKEKIYSVNDFDGVYFFFDIGQAYVLLSSDFFMFPQKVGSFENYPVLCNYKKLMTYTDVSFDYGFNRIKSECLSSIEKFKTYDVVPKISVNESKLCLARKTTTNKVYLGMIRDNYIDVFTKELYLNFTAYWYDYDNYCVVVEMNHCYIMLDYGITFENIVNMSDLNLLNLFRMYDTWYMTDFSRLSTEFPVIEKNYLFDEYTYLFRTVSEYKFYLCYFEENKIKDFVVNDEMHNLAIQREDNLLIGDEVFNASYNLSTYDEAVQINSFVKLNDYKSSTGKVIVEKVVIDDILYYKYLLYEMGTKQVLTFVLDGFIPGYNIADFLSISYLIVEDNSNTLLLFELVTVTGKRILFDVTSNVFCEKSVMIISSVDYSYSVHDGIIEYWLYFNSSIAVENWISMSFGYAFHKELTIFGIFDFKYGTNEGSYLVTAEGEPVVVLNGLDKFIAEKICRYDINWKANFGYLGYTVDGRFYSYKMRFLVTGISSDRIYNFLLSGGTSLVNMIINENDKYVVVDYINPVEVEYVKNGVTYNKIKVVDGVDIGPGDENPGDGKPTDPDDTDDPDLINDPFNMKAFFQAIAAAIKSDTLGEKIGRILIKYYGAAILTLIFIILFFVFIRPITNFVSFVIKGIINLLSLPFRMISGD